jgi:hypothetical protein
MNDGFEEQFAENGKSIRFGVLMRGERRAADPEAS